MSPRQGADFNEGRKRSPVHSHRVNSSRFQAVVTTDRSDRTIAAWSS
jgi:hypothetical protein